MKIRYFSKGFVSLALVWTAVVMPIAATAQTAVSLPKNKYKVQDDLKLGREASVEAEKQFPILRDAETTQYVEQVGERLVASIPPQFRVPEFDYRFKVVNASDINAFALPGGPMYVNRGMIEAARNEGEMAGVMAHEISHVALRHATAQATRQSSVGNTLGTIGLILGGAILGGQTGAQLGALTAMTWMTKYSREYETQADIVGARIMADAGYDPRDLANMFQTIAQRSGGARAPEWLSSHPDPGNRFQKINQEAALLNVSPNPIKITREFERIQSRLRGMPPARTMAQISQDYKSGQGSTNSAMTGGRYSNSVALPSTRTRVYSGGNVFSINVPTNWREIPGDNSVTFAPEGAYGDQGVTHGAMIGVFRPQDNTLGAATERFVNNLLQSNQYLRRGGGSTNAYVSSRRGYSTMLNGRSPVTGRNETVIVYTAALRSGDVFYMITVAPNSESFHYDTAFRSMLNSVQFNG